MCIIPCARINAVLSGTKEFTTKKQTTKNYDINFPDQKLVHILACIVTSKIKHNYSRGLKTIDIDTFINNLHFWGDVKFVDE